MTNSSLTPLQITAGSGLLQNQGLQVSPAFTAALNAYYATPTISALRQAMTLGGSTYPGLFTLGQATCATLGNSPPPAYTSTGTTSTGWANVLAVTAAKYLGNGDYSKFAQAEAICQGYCDQVNPFINSAVNSQSYLGPTFSNSNNMLTGEITAINLATAQWGSDLQNLGRLWNLENIDALGSPLALTKQLASVGSLTPALAFAFNDASVPLEVVVNINSPTLSVTDAVQKKMYTAMTKITGADLIEVLALLKVTTAGLTSMADLLNPYKIFPNSFLTLTITTVQGVSKKIYLDNQGTVNMAILADIPPCDDCACTPLSISYPRLATIIPPDQAVANKALSYSMKQVAGITNMQLPAFAAAVSGIQSLVGLPLINAQKSAVPAASANYFANNIAKGSSVNGTFVIADFLGTLAGIPGTQSLTTIVATMKTMNLSYLTLCYTTMVNALSGLYNVPDATEPTAFDVVIPGGLPAAGTYLPTLVPNTSPPPAYTVVVPAIKFAMDALIAVTNSTIASIAGSQSQSATLTTQWNNIGSWLTKETANQAKVNLVWGNLVANNQPSTMSLVQSIPGMSWDTAVGGQVQFFNLIANQATAPGQAVVGLLRQGNTTVALNSVGITNSNNIPQDPTTPAPQANIGPTTYPYP